jgi:hypothetical protein
MSTAYIGALNYSWYLQRARAATNNVALAGIASVLVIGAIGTYEIHDATGLQSSINQFVARTGEGDIVCTFKDAASIFVNKKLVDIDAAFRPLVASGLTNGSCTATLSK